MAKGCTEEIYLAVCRDDKDRPKLSGKNCFLPFKFLTLYYVLASRYFLSTDSQTILGPVILVGPPTVALLKPIVLSFQHCASLKHGQWSLSLYSCDSPYDEPLEWQVRENK